MEKNSLRTVHKKMNKNRDWTSKFRDFRLAVHSCIIFNYCFGETTINTTIRTKQKQRQFISLYNPLVYFYN